MDGGRTTLRTLRRGDVFRTADGLLWRRTSSHFTATEVQGNVALCDHVGRESAATFLPLDAEVEPLDIPALLSELAELRTLTHDLLIDRDAAYGREVGRGEALATVEAEADRLLGLSKNATAGKHHRSLWHNQWEALVTVLSTLRALGPVRPLPPPERLAARCRALEDALGACVAQMEAHIPVEGEAIDAALEGARGLLEAERGTVP
jgi:hypothetical protein